MTQYRLSFFLIFSLLITPVVSAFDHCVEIGMSEHLMKSKMMSMADNTAPQDSKVLLEQSAELHCHHTNNCSSHFCSPANTPSSYRGLYSTSAALFSDFKVSASTSPNYPSLFRPPISTVL